MTENINYWLMKSEPSVYGIDHLRKEGETLWDGIRNYQARNFMRQMKQNDRAFFYHSNCKAPSICGLMEIKETNIIDPTQFNENSKYFDPKSKKSAPKWDCVKVLFLAQFKNELTLEILRDIYSPEQLIILKRGNRLSITPVINIIAKDILKRIDH